MIVIIEHENGISVMRTRSPHAAEQVEKWEQSGNRAAIRYRVLSFESDLPTDYTFRNAWTYDLDVDMDKARVIHMDRIRAARDEALKVLDIETLKGIDVQTEKQALRDIPQTFDLSGATTPDELKALWPAELA